MLQPPSTDHATEQKRSQRKIIAGADAIAQMRQGLRDAGQTLVTTNGCFDILHTGHLRYLQAAKDCGDFLWIAINSDASVQRLKGPKRPILPEGQRAELLAGLSCVDAVTLFDEDTPEDFLVSLAPDIHVKGAQYTVETLPEAPALQAVGSRLEFMDMVEGQSTSAIVQRILDTH